MKLQKCLSDEKGIEPHFQAWEQCFQHALEWKRQPNLYGDILIIDCNPDRWYRDLIGVVIPHCLLKFHYRNPRTHEQWSWRDAEHGFIPHREQVIPWLYEVYPTRLTRTREYRGRSIAAQHIILL